MTIRKFPDLEDIKMAHRRIAGYIHHTPTLTSTAINWMAGCEIFFKCENFQKVGAFKARGAANAVLKLTLEERQHGVATHSSGNHAAALARAAALSGVKSYIVMPTNAPAVKKDAVREYGGEIIPCEPNQNARETTLHEVIHKTGAVFIPPFDHWDVIEGQATCALEMLHEQIEYDIIMTPVGGGGLLAGTALAVHYLSPDTRVIGGEPLGADDAFRSFKSKVLLPAEKPKTIADGLLTSLGTFNFQVIQKYVSDIFTVSEQEIIEAMRLIFERMKIVIEPSSAVPLAAILANRDVFKSKKVGCIISGGNVDLKNLPF